MHNVRGTSKPLPTIEYSTQTSFEETCDRAQETLRNEVHSKVRWYMVEKISGNVVV